MAKTVKELIEKFNLENPLQTEIDCACNSGYTEYKYCFCEWLEIKKQLLRNILKAHEKELAEKDKEIKELEKNCLCKYCRELHIHIESIEKDKNGCKFRHKLPSKEDK